MGTSREEWLSGEVDAWRRDGLLTEEQARAIRARYEKAAESEGRGRLVAVLATCGAILVGIGVILFIASNWEGIPRPAKVTLVFATILAAYGAGFHLKYGRGDYPRVGEGIIFLGSLLYGGAIFLIAQIFNINAHYPNGCLAWALGVIPLAYVAVSPAVLSVALVNIGIWIALESDFWVHETNARLALVYFALAALAVAVGRIHGLFERTRAMRVPYLALGVGAMVTVNYIFTFQVASYWWKDEPSGAEWAFWGFTAAAAAVAVATLLLGRGKAKTIAAEFAAFAGLLVLASLAFLLYRKEALWVQVAANVVLFGIIMGIIVLGHVHRQRYLVNIGFVFFAIDVVTRYFDWLFDLMPRSLFFIAFGVLLSMGGLWLEGRRKALVAGISEGGAR